MTTYPLSEMATIYAVEESGDATSTVVGQGTLADCADIVAGFDWRKQKSIVIQMDNLDLRFGPREIGELLQFLRDEGAGTAAVPARRRRRSIEQPDRGYQRPRLMRMG